MQKINFVGIILFALILFDTCAALCHRHDLHGRYDILYHRRYRYYSEYISMSIGDDGYEKYSGSSSIAKGIVSGLTNIYTMLRRPATTVQPRVYNKQSLTIGEVFRGIVGDFERGYLFNGEIDEEIYAEDCVFTDPTLTFRGLTTFVNNIAAIKPLVKAFLTDTVVLLYSIDVNQSSSTIVTTWRMSGGVKLPWTPRIDLSGRTKFTVDPSQDGRIVDYFESWSTPAITVLVRLLVPSSTPNYGLVANIQKQVGGEAVRKAPTSTSFVLKQVKENLESLLSAGSTAPDFQRNLDRLILTLEFIYSLGTLPNVLLSSNTTLQSAWETIYTNSTGMSLSNGFNFTTIYQDRDLMVFRYPVDSGILVLMNP